MNSRERLLKAINCEIPDRVPISTYELVGFNSKSFENNDQSYFNLMEYIRKYTDCICMWNPESDEKIPSSSFNADIKTDILKEEGCTIRRNIINTPKGLLTQNLKIIDNIYTVWQVEHLCKCTEDVDKLLSIPFKAVNFDFSDYTRIKGEVGDKGIIMATVPDPLLLAADLMEFGEFTVWALTETDHFANTIKIMHERNMQNLKKMLEGNIVDLYRICGPEYATPPYLPPVFFKNYVVPYVSEMVDLIHSKGGKVRLHCHGRIGKILSMIVDTGADSIDPCEAPPDGDINLLEVKKILKNKMCIMGNIQLKILENGESSQIIDAVKECMNAAKENGCYVIMPTAAPINSPLSKKTEENYYTYIESALEYGEY